MQNVCHLLGDIRNQIIGTSKYNPESSWRQTLCAFTGRPFPALPLLGTVAAAAVVLVLWVKVSNAADNEVLVNSSMHTFIGLAAFFLLSFRANASYDRWYEGRKQWGMVINRTRDISRQITTYISDDGIEGIEGGVWRRALGHVAAFPVAMKRHLRDEKGMMEARDILSEADVQAILAAKHMPLYILDVLSAYVETAMKAGDISDIQAMAIDANLTGFEDYLGAAERIKKTPMRK